jgi:hypothetical protein
VSDRRYLAEGSMALLNPPEPTVMAPHIDQRNEVVDHTALQTA